MILNHKIIAVICVATCHNAYIGLYQYMCAMLQLRLDEDHIQESHPGEPVLSHHNCGQLFTQSISPAACGVIASNDTCLGKLLSEYQPGVWVHILPIS